MVMQERRRFHRHQVFKPARLFGQTDVVGCIVRDISASGMRLALVSTAGIPETIDLSFDGARTLRPCRVVWRTPTEIGVEFKERLFRSAA
jgi:PilZ domain-containing protein